MKVLETEVTTITLDSYLRERKITVVDLVKIDVETHEPEVLSGFIEGLTQFRPVLLIEILNEDVGKRVEAIVQKLGYRYFNIDEKGGIRETEHIGKSDFYNYLLCDNNTVN